MVIWPVANHLVHDLIRRGNGDKLYPGHGRPQSTAARLSLRLLLDARVSMVRFRVGLARLSRPGSYAGTAQSARSADLGLDQPLPWPALATVCRGGAGWIPPQAAQWRYLAVGLVAAWHGYRRFHQPRRPRMVRRKAPRPDRYRRGLLQNRLWRADSDRCYLL